jgi:hypothetical protein
MAGENRLLQVVACEVSRKFSPSVPRAKSSPRLKLGSSLGSIGNGLRLLWLLLLPVRLLFRLLRWFLGPSRLLSLRRWLLLLLSRLMIRLLLRRLLARVLSS